MGRINKFEKGREETKKKLNLSQIINNLSNIINKIYKFYQSKMDELSEVIIVRCKNCKNLFLKRPLNPYTLFCSVGALGPMGPMLYLSYKKEQFCPNCGSSNFEVSYEEMQKQYDLPTKESKFRYAALGKLSDTPYVLHVLWEGKIVISIVGVIMGLAGILLLRHLPGWLKIAGILAIINSISIFYLLKRMNLSFAERLTN